MRRLTIRFALPARSPGACRCRPGTRARQPRLAPRHSRLQKIAGNLYYVGTADLAAYLITTPQGNILINGDFKEDVPAIRKSIEGLGFKYADTKIILISHAHGDHDEGVGVIKSETGATAHGDGRRRGRGRKHRAGTARREGRSRAARS